MARRSTVQRGNRTSGDPELSAYAADVESPWPEREDIGGGKGRPLRWNGGGGRWLIWIGRTILWAFIVVVVVNGIQAPFARITQERAPGGPTAVPNGPAFPSAQAGAFAAQFANVYLNYDASKADERAARLAAFVPEGAEQQFGWNGTGKLLAGSLQVHSVEVRDDKNALVTIAAQVGDRRMLLSVPVHTITGGFVVSGRPALLPAPRKVLTPPLQAAPQRDSVTENELRPQLGNFFKAYAQGDSVQLQRFVVSGVVLDSFGGALTFDQLKDVIVPSGDVSRQVTASVVWRLPTAGQTSEAQGGTLEQTYQLTMEKQGGNWFVKDIRGASQSVG